jgi:hypothetical protein
MCSHALRKGYYEDMKGGEGGRLKRSRRQNGFGRGYNINIHCFQKGGQGT